MPDRADAVVPSETKVEVWDLPTRLFHWSLVACLGALWFTGEVEFLDLHETVGVAVLILISFRLLWGFLGGEFARFTSFVRGPSAVKAYLASILRWKRPNELGHNPVGGWSVLVMLFAITLQAGTGLFVTDDDYDAPFSRFVSSGTARFFTDLHEAGFNVILVLVGVHLASIAFYFVVFRKNLVGPMIHGTALADSAIVPARIRLGPVWLAMICLALSAVMVIWGVYFI